MGECSAREVSISESDPGPPNERGTGNPAPSDAEGALLARQIATFDGEMSFDLGARFPTPITTYNPWKTAIPAIETSRAPGLSDNAEELARDFRAVPTIEAIPMFLGAG